MFPQRLIFLFLIMTIAVIRPLYAQQDLIHEEQDHSLLVKAQARCIETDDPSQRGPVGTDFSDEVSLDSIGNCLIEEFTNIAVEEMHEFIFFQGAEIYRYCTSGERDARMDNFEDCMQPFHTLIERVSAPCREAFGEGTKASYACLNVFNEKMLNRIKSLESKEQPSDVKITGFVFTLAAILLVALAMVVIFKKL